MFKVPDCDASDPGSTPGQVSNFIIILFNSSNYTKIMKKLECLELPSHAIERDTDFFNPSGNNRTSRISLNSVVHFLFLFLKSKIQ